MCETSNITADLAGLASTRALADAAVANHCGLLADCSDFSTSLIQRGSVGCDRLEVQKTCAFEVHFHRIFAQRHNPERRSGFSVFMTNGPGGG